MRVVILVRSLALAGAERQAALTARGLAERGHNVTMVLLQDDDGDRAELEAVGVAVVCLGSHGLATSPRTIVRLLRLLRSTRPDAIYGYMDGPNVLVSTVGHAVPGAVLVCGLRASELATRDMPRLARLLYRLEPLVVRGSDLVIVNSMAGYQAALERRFAPGRLRLVPNGIDVGHFRRDEAAAAKMREALGVAADEVLIGRVGRMHPMKGYDTMIVALAQLHESGLRARSVFVGAGALEPSLRSQADEVGLGGAIIWVAPRADLRAIYSACDLVVSSSRYGEGMPNVVGEAMACGVRCVVTDVGDSAELVGDTGVVVPPEDPSALAGALAAMVTAPPGWKVGGSPRKRIVERYSLERMILDTESAVAVGTP